jgi:hypothetical protein
MNASANRRPLDGQLALFDAPAVRRKRYVPTHSGDFSATHARLDAIHAEFRGLKPYERRCHGCDKIISSKAPVRPPFLPGRVQELVT